VRVGERAADDEVDLIDGLGCKAAAGRGVEERFVERLDLLVSDPAGLVRPRMGRMWRCTLRS
jgi:hypothetical protein